MKFCPIILRLISCSALGNLDINSGGTISLLLCCLFDGDDCSQGSLFRLLFFLFDFLVTAVRPLPRGLVKPGCSDNLGINSWGE